ncbi:MAG TPA: hypothetical protein VJ837_04730, partial [Candidatus Paceibacterota bacterium]|nr:hypothetical protein [Candidatus Paceibacterota bacterium]
IEPRELRKLRDRLQRFRDEVLHLSDKSEEGRTLGTTYSATPPRFTFRSSVGRRKLEFDEITRDDIENVLRILDPWLQRQWNRLVHEDPAPREPESARGKDRCDHARSQPKWGIGMTCGKAGGHTDEFAIGSSSWVSVALPEAWHGGTVVHNGPTIRIPWWALKCR